MLIVAVLKLTTNHITQPNLMSYKFFWTRKHTFTIQLFAESQLRAQLVDQPNILDLSYNDFQNPLTFCRRGVTLMKFISSSLSVIGHSILYCGWFQPWYAMAWPNRCPRILIGQAKCTKAEINLGTLYPANFNCQNSLFLWLVYIFASEMTFGILNKYWCAYEYLINSWSWLLESKSALKK